MKNIETETEASISAQEEEDAGTRIAASEADIAAGRFTKGSASELMMELGIEASSDKTSE